VSNIILFKKDSSVHDASAIHRIRRRVASRKMYCRQFNIFQWSIPPLEPLIFKSYYTSFTDAPLLLFKVILSHLAKKSSLSFSTYLEILIFSLFLEDYHWPFSNGNDLSFIYLFFSFSLFISIDIPSRSVRVCFSAFF